MKKITQNLRWLVTLLVMLVSVGAWATKYKLTITASDFNTTSYAANNNEKTTKAVCTSDASKTFDVKWTSNQVMKNGDNMQWQKSKGYLYNSTNLGTITNVTVTSSAGTFTTYYGTSEHPTSGTTVGNGFFTVIVGSALGTSSKVEVVFEIGGSVVDQVSAPTFSPDGGTYTETQSVTLSCATEGATIYYTTDGNDPTTNSTEYSGAIEISKNTTIKAIAVKEGYDNSEVATAIYTIMPPISGYTIDFEHPLSDYELWTFTNISKQSDITAHGGTFYGANVNENGNGVTSATIQTKEPVVNPATFTCYVSKTTNNTKTSTWYVEVSSDEEAWTEVASHSASSMDKGEWIEVTADLSSYSNVFVRLRYDGTAAIRAVDDISVTLGGETVDVTVTEGGALNDKFYATYSNAEKALDFSAVEGLKAYYVTSASTSALTITEASKVPAGTAVLIEGAEAKTYQVPVITSGTDDASNNRLLVSNGNVLGDGQTIYVLGNGNNGVGFYLKKKDSAIAAGKAYLEIAAGEAKSFLSLGGDDAVAISNVEAEQGTGVLYNLNGQRVAAPVKGGLYIMNGKKVLVK